MDRKPTWKADLREYLALHESTPFALGASEGTIDCGAFAGGAVEAITGENPYVIFAGKYDTMPKALVLLRKMGFADHIEYTASVLSELEQPTYARFGDIAAVQGEEFLALGVVTGAQVEVRGPDGRKIVPLTDAIRVFRV